MTSTKGRTDPAEIIRAYRLIVGDGNPTELRALDAQRQGDYRPATLFGYFDDGQALAAAVQTIAAAKGIYIVPNAVNPALLARAANRIKQAGALAAEIPTATPAAAGQATAHASGERFDVADFIRRHGLEVEEPRDWNGKQGAGKKWTFTKSPMCDHHGDGPFIVQQPKDTRQGDLSGIIRQGEPPDKPEQPQAVRYIVSDTTVAALAPLLLANPRGLLLARDELAGWLGSFDRYAKSGKGGADAVRRRNGEIDPKAKGYAKEARRPLSEHLADFRQYLQDKQNTAKYVDLICSRVGTRPR